MFGSIGIIIIIIVIILIICYIVIITVQMCYNNDITILYIVIVIVIIIVNITYYYNIIHCYCYYCYYYCSDVHYHSHWGSWDHQDLLADQKRNRFGLPWLAPKTNWLKQIRTLGYFFHILRGFITLLKCGEAKTQKNNIYDATREKYDKKKH